MMMKTATAEVSLRSARYLGVFPRLKNDQMTLIGQDGGQSISLGDKFLFVFSDTLVAPSNNLAIKNPHPPSPIPTPYGQQSIFLANTAGISDERDLRRALAHLRYFTDDEGLPREILSPDKETERRRVRFWPEHGVFIDGRVYLFYLGIQTIDSHSIWGFRNVGTGLMVLNPETGETRQVLDGRDWCLWKADADDFHFGVQVVHENDYVYIFASFRRGFDTSARLARVHPQQIEDLAAYEYLSSTQPRWTSNFAGSYDLGECSNEYSVSFNQYLQKYIMIYLDGHQKTLMLRTADQLWGPYTPPRKLVTVPYEKASELIYLGFEHAHFSEENGKRIYISYCQPHFVANSLLTVTFA
jgi:hypothetical protein